MTVDPKETRVRRRDGIVARRVAGETLLVPTGIRTLETERRSAELFVLNATGELLWARLATPATMPELARILMKEFDVSFDAALADATTFVDSLRALGMLADHE